MTNDLRILKKELKSFAKRVKDFKYTDSALITFLLTGLIMLSGISLNLYSDEIKTQQEAINTSIFQLQKDFKRARQENNKLLRNTNLELIQLMEQGDHVVKSPWGSFQFGSNYVYNDWKGTYKGRGDKKEAIKYARENDKFGTYAGAKQGTTELKRVIEPISAVPVDAAVRPKTVTIDAIAGASAPVIKTPTLNVNVSSVTPSTASVPSITPPKVNIPTVSMSKVKGFTLFFPSSGYFLTNEPTNVDGTYDITTSDSPGFSGMSPGGGQNDYIGYHYFAAGGGITTTTPVIATMRGHGVANNIDPTNSFYYGGGSRYAFIDDVRNFTNSSTSLYGPFHMGVSQVKFILKNEARIDLHGPAIAGIVNEETSWSDGKTTTNVTNVGSINDEDESISGTYNGDLLKKASGGTYLKTITANSKNKIGYKVGITQTVEESMDWTSGTNYEFYNGDDDTLFIGFSNFDSTLSVYIISNPYHTSLFTKVKEKNIGSKFTQV